MAKAKSNKKKLKKLKELYWRWQGNPIKQEKILKQIETLKNTK